jgi:hypothetical protein
MPPLGQNWPLQGNGAMCRVERKCSFRIFAKLLEKIHIYMYNNNFALKLSRKCFIQIYEIAHFCEKAKMDFCFNPSNNLFYMFNFARFKRASWSKRSWMLEDPDALQLPLAGLRQDKG